MVMMGSSCSHIAMKVSANDFAFNISTIQSLLALQFLHQGLLLGETDSHSGLIGRREDFQPSNSKVVAHHGN